MTTWCFFLLCEAFFFFWKVWISPRGEPELIRTAQCGHVICLVCALRLRQQAAQTKVAAKCPVCSKVVGRAETEFFFLKSVWWSHWIGLGIARAIIYVKYAYKYICLALY